MKRYAHFACQEAANGYAPTAGLRFIRATYVGPEIDQWLEGSTAWEIMSLLLEREDFTMLADEGQRMFLALAAEILYGPVSDEVLRAECERIAREPI